MEVKTFDIIIGGQKCPVPAMPKLGRAREIWAAIEKYGKPESMAGICDYEMAYVAAATGKPLSWVAENVDPAEAKEAVMMIDREWLASGFFVKAAEAEAAVSSPTTGSSLTSAPKDTAGDKQT